MSQVITMFEPFFGQSPHSVRVLSVDPQAILLGVCVDCFLVFWYLLVHFPFQPSPFRFLPVSKTYGPHGFPSGFRDPGSGVRSSASSRPAVRIDKMGRFKPTEVFRVEEYYFGGSQPSPLVFRFLGFWLVVVFI